MTTYIYPTEDGDYPTGPRSYLKVCETPKRPGCRNKGVIAEGVLSLKPKLTQQLLSRGCVEQFPPLTKQARTLFESHNRAGTGYECFRQFTSDSEAIQFLRKYLGRKGDTFEVAL
jgi:hypothetical protein